MNGFAEFRNRTWIHAILEMQTALAVGSRLSLDPVGTDMPVIKDPEGRPFIPGSSIKGVVRFQAERMLRAANRKWACDPFDDPCVPATRKDVKHRDQKSKEELWEEAVKTAEKEAKEVQARSREHARSADEIFMESLMRHSCMACRLFGSPWMAGRVAFKDAHLKNHEDLPVWTQIRDGVGIDRDLGAARAGVKYDFETVIPGAQFRIEIVAENLEDRELGFLLAVLRMWKEGGIAIGGKSTRGPGWGVLKDIQIYQVTPDNLLDYLSSSQKAERKEDELIEAFMSWWKREGGHA
ncbi:type III CRISPR-associated RAMP protein Csx7 [Thermoflexus hugenholtzii]